MSSRGGPPPRGIQREGYQREQEYTVLFVAPLPRDCSPEELRNHFGQYGVVNSVSVPQDHNSRQPKSYGFVGFLNPGHAASALRNLDCRLFRGKEIVVQFARSRRKSPLEMKAKELVRSVTPLPSPTRIPSLEPSGSAHSRSPSISGSNLGRSEDESWRRQPFPAEGGRASLAGHDNHTGGGPQGVVGSPAVERRPVTPLPSPTRNPSPEPRGNAHSRSPSISGSDLRRSTLDDQPSPAEGGRASPAGHDNHTGDGPQGVTGSSADECSVVRVELGDAWRGRACGGCGQVVRVWNDHHECSTEELSQDVIPRICVTLFPKRL